MKRISPKRLSLLAMLIALQIVFSKFLMLQLTDSIRLSIDSVPILLAGVWFGPLAGALVGALADSLGTLLFPTAGAYFPPLTIAFLLIGLTAGLLAKAIRLKNGLLRAALIVIPAEIVGSYLFKSYALSLLIGVPMPVLLASRMLPVGTVMIVNTLLVATLDRLVGKQATRQKNEPQKKNTIVEAIPTQLDSVAMSYENALDYIHNVTWRGSRLGLERTRELLGRIGNPERSVKFIHVAGTNGKGSVCAMLANVLEQAGYRVGLYISPYINRFNERISINGESIPDADLAEVTARIKPFADAMADHPTEFELITAIAFDYFAKQHVDIVVLEVGMGGELDSTNVIDTPELAVIMNIGLDHTRELGSTIQEIARAKAGIIKQGGDVVIYDQNPEADEVFRAVCESKHASLTVTKHSRIRSVTPALSGLTFSIEPYAEPFLCGLVGAYQANNAAVAITAAELLQKKGWKISDQNLQDGIRLVRWPARFEVLQTRPVFIADGAHNPQGVHAAAESIRLYFPKKRVVFLLGVMADKDIAGMIEELSPLGEAFFTVTPHNPRALDAVTFSAMLRARGLDATACASIEEGVQSAIDRAGRNGVVCAIGSLYLLGDVRAIVLS